MSHKKSIRKWKLTFIFSLVFAIPTVVIAFIPVEWIVISPGFTAKEIILFVLSSIVQVGNALQWKVLVVWIRMFVNVEMVENWL